MWTLNAIRFFKPSFQILILATDLKHDLRHLKQTTKTWEESERFSLEKMLNKHRRVILWDIMQMLEKQCRVPPAAVRIVTQVKNM